MKQKIQITLVIIREQDNNIFFLFLIQKYKLIIKIRDLFKKKKREFFKYKKLSFNLYLFIYVMHIVDVLLFYFQHCYVFHY